MTNAGQQQQGGGQAASQFFYSVDGKKYDWPTANITGAQIRASIPGLNPSFQIVLEGHGSDADRPISDTDTFSLALPGHGPLQIYTAPPATFGSSGSSEVGMT